MLLLLVVVSTYQLNSVFRFETSAFQLNFEVMPVRDINKIAFVAKYTLIS